MSPRGTQQTSERPTRGGRAPDATLSKILVSLEPKMSAISAQIGTKNQVQVFGVYSDMSRQDVTNQVTWTSSDTNVVWAPFAADDPFHIVGPGAAILTATLGDLSTTVTITVPGGFIPPGATLLGFGIVGGKPLMRPEEAEQLQLWSFYSTGQTFRRTDVIWLSSNPAALSVTSDGFVVALAAGTSTVSVRLGDKVIATRLVTIKNVTLQSISIGPADLTIPFPAPLQITATGVYSDGSTFDLTHQVNWESDPDLGFNTLEAISPVSVVAIGKVGTFRISASFEGTVASASVAVRFGTPNSIELQEAPMLPVGVSYPVVAYAFYANEYGLNVTDLVTWSVDDPTILSMGAGGEIRGLKAGTTQVHASYPGFTIAPLPVTVSPAALLTLDSIPLQFRLLRR